MAPFLPMFLFTLVNDLLTDSFRKLIQNATVANKQLRLKSP